MTIAEQLYRVPTGQLAHLRACPHIVGREVVPADPDFAACRWTQDELDGKGRLPQKSLDVALETFRVSPLSRPRVRELLANVSFDSVYLPRSESYIALTRAGRAVAWVGKTYVQIGSQFEPLPDYRPGAGGGLGVSELWGESCTTCFQERARNGTCACTD